MTIEIAVRIYDAGIITGETALVHREVCLGWKKAWAVIDRFLEDDETRKDVVKIKTSGRIVLALGI